MSSTKLAIVINLHQLENYMEEFVNSNDASANQWETPDALKHRLYMGQFLIWLRNKLKEQSNGNQAKVQH